jgi:drug/metabolite transporter (DMT)-like permease
LLQNAPARLTGTYAFVNPVVAVALGWWLLDETVGWRTLAAMAVIVAGVALIASQSQRETRLSSNCQVAERDCDLTG